MELVPGTELQGGSYRVEGALGSGGFGTTYRTAQVSAQTRTVALKEYLPRTLVRRGIATPVLFVPEANRPAFDAGLRKFVREGQILRGLSHPNIVWVQEVFEENGTAYLVMEFVGGGNLSRELRQSGGRLLESRVRQIMGDLVAALDVLHGAPNPVFHLDIKPENVMLRPNGSAVLVDFGAARRAEGHSTHSHLVLTPNFAAPELLLGGSPGPRCDLYSLGVLLHLLVTGELPPSAGDRLAGGRGGATWKPVTLAPWSPLIARAMELDPDRRPRSVVEWWRSDVAPVVPVVPAPSATHAASAQDDHEQWDDIPEIADDSIPVHPSPVAPKWVTSPEPVATPVEASRAVAAPKQNPTDGAEMVWIPAGSFAMGSDEGGADEQPRRVVELSGFRMYRHPVTVAQFRRFAQTTTYGYNWIARTPPWGWQDAHPMVNVSWEDAQAYCLWVGGALPTEAQWEKAARGTDGRRYPWGEVYDEARLWGSVTARRSETAPVRRLVAVCLSPFGCADMAGNVRQWCADRYRADYYASAPSQNPPGPATGSYRVLRGGSWSDTNPASFRAARRGDNYPNFRGLDIGFRVALPGE